MKPELTRQDRIVLYSVTAVAIAGAISSILTCILIFCNIVEIETGMGLFLFSIFSTIIAAFGYALICGKRSEKPVCKQPREPETVFTGPVVTKDGVEFVMGMDIWRVNSFVDLSWTRYETGWVYKDEPYYYLCNGELCTKLHSPDIGGADKDGNHYIPVCEIVECYADRDKALVEYFALLDGQIASIENEKRLLIEKIIR